MASVSSATNSLGNTSLRGYGGLSSGIDRDAIIEQMTSGTQAKITNQQSKITKMTWKQEAYRGISDMILAMQDSYFSLSATSSLKDASVFAKNRVTTLGDSNVTKFVTASGQSSMVDYLSILGVKQMASSTTLMSEVKQQSGSIKTNITEDSLTDTVYKTSNLEGTKLEFGTYDADKKFNSAGAFTFPAYYTDKDANGKEIKVYLDYTADMTQTNTATGKTYGEELAEGLNKALEQSGIKSGDDKIADVMQFNYKDGIMKLEAKDGKSTNLVIYKGSTALKALGYNSTATDGTAKNEADGISLSELADGQKDFSENYVTNQNMVQFLRGKKLSFSFGGQTKSIELVKSGDQISSLDDLVNNIQDRLDKAFGKDNIKVGVGQNNGVLKFGLGNNASKNQTLTISSDDVELRKTLGIQNGASNKISEKSSIKDNIDKLLPGATEEEQEKFLENLKTNGLVINGVKIKGVTENTTISDMIEKINSNTEAGVKASYLSSTNQFVLISSETGKGREIDLEGASLSIFGARTDKGELVDSNFKPSDTEKLASGSLEDGKNAEILVSYGNGIKTMLESSSNSFDLEGMKVTVSGIFGDVKEETEGSGVYTSDTSKAVTFSASADVDGVTEKVKKFFEEYNALVTEVNKQITTKSDSSYGPLTDAQKAEMSETSIENWEKKAKEGLLYNDSIMRTLSADLQAVMTSMLNSGMSYEDLEDMGITMSDDYLDGGTITFDEAKFKAAMTEDPEKVSKVFAGGGEVTSGLTDILDDTLTKYATRYRGAAGTYGMLIEEAGSSKVPLSVMDNEIYRQLKDMQEVLDKFKSQLKTQQDRYIHQFSTMESLISQMNAQSSYLDQLQS